MNARTIVIALGGNALAPGNERPTIANQFHHTRQSLGPIVELARDGWRIALVHGNGPQVGDSLARNELAEGEVEPLPLGVLVAETAGWIGYMIQQSLQNALAHAGIDRDVVTLITQTVVRANDPLLSQPTKPIGHKRKQLAASPLPIGIVEKRVLVRLVNAGTIVVAAGGGGPPVYRHAKLGWEGLDAVVDKDRTAAILACELEAEILMILTSVDGVYRDFGTKRQALVKLMTVREAEAMLEAGTLAAGSMRPKVEAAVTFVRQSGGKAVIAELTGGPAALRGETGTTIVAGDA